MKRFLLSVLFVAFMLFGMAACTAGEIGGAIFVGVILLIIGAIAILVVVLKAYKHNKDKIAAVSNGIQQVAAAVDAAHTKLDAIAKK